MKFEEIIIFLKFCPKCARTRVFSRNIFPAHFVGFLHGVRRIRNLIAKSVRPANARDVNPLETIWIIFDEKTYKHPAPKSLDWLGQ